MTAPLWSGCLEYSSTDLKAMEEFPQLRLKTVHSGWNVPPAPPPGQPGALDFASGGVVHYAIQVASGKHQPGINVRGCGAAGSAPAWHAGGQGFESPQLHHVDKGRTVRKDGPSFLGIKGTRGLPDRSANTSPIRMRTVNRKLPC